VFLGDALELILGTVVSAVLRMMAELDRCDSDKVFDLSLMLSCQVC
jgi:hypothetical protein